MSSEECTREEIIYALERLSHLDCSRGYLLEEAIALLRQPKVEQKTFEEGDIVINCSDPDKKEFRVTDARSHILVRGTETTYGFFQPISDLIKLPKPATFPITSSDVKFLEGLLDACKAMGWMHTVAQLGRIIDRLEALDQIEKDSNETAS